VYFLFETCSAHYTDPLRESLVSLFLITHTYLILPYLYPYLQVKELKAALVDLLGGMPVTKQQLRIPGGAFFKDAQTLAALNVGDGDKVELSLKTRGGKK
jgi:hypothetical protein